ncbi:auxin-binding protein ABP19b-like [Neltuma alba]|uniref:auxin-binding protein ABP19b-like n=1 Tax=Neltuma alba TaxID=207710 RepID=UPI0010A43611|nr:auxin-binding protein ABP19b-like [Prosopis alba]XP_028751501.1 auxin-binding protein ABP19b-like [Prosopis alba]
MIALVSFVLFLISSPSFQASALDFCVADKAGPIGPNGFSCKDPKKVTVDDFVFSGLHVPANSTNMFKFGFKPVFDAQLPGLNTLGFAMARADFEKGSAVPIHSHPGVSEITFLLEGKVRFGFISSDNTVYQKSLVKGDVFVVPPGLLHFAFNEGDTSGTAIVGFSSSSPPVQVLDLALFQSNLASPVIASTTLINLEEVKRLKGVFKGSG